MVSTEEQLERVQNELATLKDEYQEFVYVTSHNLGAPFRIIDGFANIIAECHKDDFDDETKKHFNSIIQETREGKDILDALLKYSRLNTRAEPFIAVDCNELVNEVKIALTDLIVASDALIEVSDLPIITADKQQIKQVFYCLLKNSLTYYTEGNQPYINISAEEKDHAWQFFIEDNGIGIRSNATEMIFKLLRRAVGDKYPHGVGMGLSIVKKILQRHSGDIWVKAEEGVGSIFYFTIGKL